MTRQVRFIYILIFKALALNIKCLLQSGALQVDSSPCFRKAQNDKKISNTK